MGNKPASKAAAPGKDEAKTADGLTETQKARKKSRFIKSVEGSMQEVASDEDVNSKYVIDQKVLGHGHYGIVRKCTARATGEAFAIKTIKKSRVSRPEVLVREIEILNRLHHPHIISVTDVFNTKEEVHIVTEMCEGGELFDRIIAMTKTKEGHYSEANAALLLRQILLAIGYCHSLDPPVCHRDLKPENFLFKTKADDSPIKIIDFGLSKYEEPGEKLHTRVGTPYYIAPEVLKRNYSLPCDMWSIGVITYILLCGYPPFYGDNDRDIFKRIQAGSFSFPHPEWTNVSEEAKAFITSLLQQDPEKRPTAADALHHAWIERAWVASGGSAAEAADVAVTVPSPTGAAHVKAAFDGDTAAMQATMGEVGKRMQRFVGMAKLKKMALNVLAYELTESDIGNLKGVFEAMDADSSGKLSVEELEQALNTAEKGGTIPAEEIQTLMQGMDIDGNNTIDYHEFLAATMKARRDRASRSRGARASRSLAAAARRAHRARSLTAANIAPFSQRNTFIREENIRRVFDFLDSDSSSSITVENLIQIMGSPEHAREVIAEADLTGDGVITYAEFKQLMTAQSATPRHLGAASGADEKAAPEGKEEGKRVAFA